MREAFRRHVIDPKMIFMPWNWSSNTYNRRNVLHEYKFQVKQPWGEFYIQQAAAGLIGGRGGEGIHRAGCKFCI